MKLIDYLSGHSTGSALARAIGAPQELVSQWKTGVRPVPLERAVAIESATGGLVTRIDLRPDDWHVMWPELAEKHPELVPGAAAPPAAEPAQGRAA